MIWYEHSYHLQWQKLYALISDPVRRHRVIADLIQLRRNHVTPHLQTYLDQLNYLLRILLWQP